MIIPGARALQLFGDEYHGLLIAILPPGAFILLGLLIAARNCLGRARSRRDNRIEPHQAKRRRPDGNAREQAHAGRNPDECSSGSRREPASEKRSGIWLGLPAAGGRGAVGAGDRQGRERRHAQAVPHRADPGSHGQLGVDGVEDLIRTIGLFRAKARNVVALSHLLLERHGGEVPRNRAALEALPGVGRKTANVVLNIVFHEPTMAVDTHIFRVANRIGLAPGKDVLAVEHGLLKVVPAEFMLHAHHWLILHGRYTCTARKPTRRASSSSTPGPSDASACRPRPWKPWPPTWSTCTPSTTICLKPRMP
jgi:endonuclease III